VSSVRGSRPTPALVEDIAVDYFDQKTPLKHLASISVVPPRELRVQVWDRNAVDPVESAIVKKLDIQTARDGNTIHCNLPELTKERKDEIIKAIKNKMETARIQSRMVRDDIKKEVEELEKNGDITEDEKLKRIDDIQKGMDEFNKKLQELMDAKVLEISS